MARQKSKSSAEASSGPRKLLRSRGPLSPGETEIIVYAGLKDQEIIATPDQLQLKSRAVINLITDRPALAANIPHRNLVEVSDVPTLRLRLMKVGRGSEPVLPAENQAAIAGGMEIIDSALPDAFKIILFVEDGDPVLPPLLSDWKAAKLDKRTSPPSITLVRL